MEFQISKSSSGYPQKYYWKIVSGSNTLATSEMYYNKADAVNAAKSVKANASSAEIVDNTSPSASYSRRW